MSCDGDVCFVVYLFFFFKQKTAYEMRISDWSSDVCPSDLVHHGSARDPCCPRAAWRIATGGHRQRPRRIRRARHRRGPPPWPAPAPEKLAGQAHAQREIRHVAAVGSLSGVRSEEHTSELQSLMRISYAVFCLKKKNKTKSIK